jgi:hypothetical protein
MGVHVAYLGYERFIKILVRKPDGKRPLGIPSHRRKDNTVMALRK